MKANSAPEITPGKSSGSWADGESWGVALSKLLPEKRYSAVLAIGAVLSVLSIGQTYRFVVGDPLEEDWRKLRSSSSDLQETRYWNERMKAELVNAPNKYLAGRFLIATESAEDASAIRGALKPYAAGDSNTRLLAYMRGFDDACAADAGEVAVFGSASEGFSRANVNAGVDEALARFAPVIAAARSIDLPVRGDVSCVVECPYDGAVDPGAVARVADRRFAMGCHEVSLGDTLGRATPDGIVRMLMAVRDVVPVGRLAGHYHDTGGHALSNIDASLSLGLRIFDASVGGLGGCPYAPGAAGNVATEAVAAHLHRLGYETGLDLEAVEQAAEFARGLVGRAGK